MIESNNFSSRIGSLPEINENSYDEMKVALSVTQLGKDQFTGYYELDDFSDRVLL